MDRVDRRQRWDLGLQLCWVPLVGVFELAAVMCLALAACSVDPDRASAVLIAAAGGVALGGLLALVGVRDLNSALVGPRTPDTRLDGIYGNSNFLAYAVAFCVPVLVVLSLRKRGYVRVLLLISLSTAAVILALTFSRGGLLAACCGGVAAAILAATSRRRVALTATVAIALVAVSAPVLYPMFAERRSEADFGPMPSSAPVAADRSGWDPGAQGVVSRGGARLTNPGPGILQVSSSEAGQGTSVPLDPIDPSQEYVLTFDARSGSAPLQVLYALEDNAQGLGPVIARADLARRWATAARTLAAVGALGTAAVLLVAEQWDELHTSEERLG